MIRLLLAIGCGALASCITNAPGGLRVQYNGDVGGVPVSVQWDGQTASVLVDSHGRPASPTWQK